MKQELLLFLIAFVFIWLIYQIFVVSKTKKGRKKGIIKHPTEILYLVSVYKLDLNEVDYNLLLQVMALVSSFDIALVVSICSLVKGYFLSIILCFISTIILILITYHIVYLIFRKKGKKND